MFSVPVVEVALVISVASDVETEALPYSEAIERVVMVGFPVPFNPVRATFLLTSNDVSWLELQSKYVSATFLLTSNDISWLL